MATVHRVTVILNAAKDLTWTRVAAETLRCAEDDDTLLAHERLPSERLPNHETTGILRLCAGAELLRLRKLLQGDFFLDRCQSG